MLPYRTHAKKLLFLHKNVVCRLKKIEPMIIEHLGKRPEIDKSAYIAPNATICGEVSIGKNTRIMFGAQIIGESSPIEIGENCIILENAVIRGTNGLPVKLGDNCLVGPNAHLAGCTIENNVFFGDWSFNFL